MLCNKGSFSVLRDYSSLEVFLKETFLYTGQRIKKLPLTKKNLSLPLKKGQSISLPLDVLNYLMISPTYAGPSVCVLKEEDSVWVYGDNAGALYMSADPHDEPIARGGPFVMNTKEEILKAFKDYENGTLQL